METSWFACYWRFWIEPSYSWIRLSWTTFIFFRKVSYRWYLFIYLFICNQSVRYAQSKRNHSYKLELHDLKAFFSLPRRSMFLKYSADIHNDAVSSMMTRNKFHEIIKYLDFSNNTSFDPDDKFGKVRLLLNKLNASVFPTTSLSKQ